MQQMSLQRMPIDSSSHGIWSEGSFAIVPSLMELVDPELQTDMSPAGETSLATTLDYWETPPSRIATVQFNVSPERLGTPMRPGQWLVASR